MTQGTLFATLCLHSGYWHTGYCQKGCKCHKEDIQTRREAGETPPEFDPMGKRLHGTDYRVRVHGMPPPGPLDQQTRQQDTDTN